MAFKWPSNWKRKSQVSQNDPYAALQLYMAKQDYQNQAQNERMMAQQEATSQRELEKQEFQTQQNFLKNQMMRSRNVEKVQMKEEYDLRKSMANYLSDANQALVALDKIEKGARSLGDFGRGVLPQIGAKFNIAAKSFGKDKDLTRYLGVVAQELIPMARKLMEEKGPITEWDVKRVEKGLGETTVPLEDKLFLINQMRNKVKQAVTQKMRLAQGGNIEEVGTGLIERASSGGEETGLNDDWEAKSKRLRSRYLRGSNG